MCIVTTRRWSARTLGRPMCLLRASLTVMALLLPALPAGAAGPVTFRLGTEEVLRPLQDVGLQNRNGEPLYLGYKLSFSWLGLPYAVADDGYVLAVKGKTTYYVLDNARLAHWQGQGYLPRTLPPYRLGLADYILGHLLWIVLALAIGWCTFRAWCARRAGRPQARPSPAQRRVNGLPARPARLPSPVEPVTLPPVAAPAVNAAKPIAYSQRAAPPAAAVAPIVEPPLSPAHLTRLPVAKTICRLKALKTA